MALTLKQRSVLPGFGLTLGFTVFYLCLIVLIPLSALFIKTATASWDHIWQTISSPRILASFKLTLTASLVSAFANAFFGFLVAWMLVRYEFWGKRIVDAIVDLPFAMPTAVSGIALTTIYSSKGWIGQFFEKWNGSGLRQSLDAYFVPASKWLTGLLPSMASFIPDSSAIKVAYTPIGIMIALTFIGLPFVVRTLQPALEDLEAEVEEAAASLGASRWNTFYRIIVPTILPALLTGFSLSFARALGEYGSVVFIAGNLPMKTEITPLLIIMKLEEYDYTGATAIASVMLIASFFMLLVVNVLQWWASRRQRGGK